MIFERTVAEIAGDYAVLVSESGTRTEVALALLPDRSVAVTVPMDASLTVKTASSGRALAAAPCSPPPARPGM